LSLMTDLWVSLITCEVSVSESIIEESVLKELDSLFSSSVSCCFFEIWFLSSIVKSSESFA